MALLGRLLSGGLLLVAVRGLPGCGGDAFSAPEQGGAGGQGGAGAGGQAGQGEAGAGVSGASGQPGEGPGGAGSGGQSGEAGQAGAGQSGQGGAGEAGQGGEAGAAGEAGQGGGGAAGAPAGGAAGEGGAGMSGGSGQGGMGCQCEPPKDPCGKAICDDNGSCLLVASEGYEPQDTTPGDCRQPICDGTKTKDTPSETDTPPTLGPCDTVFCSDQGAPIHKDTDSLCLPTETCVNHQCQCRPCPAGSVSGLPGDQCAVTTGTTAASKETSDKTAARAIDRSASTFWTGGGPLEISFDPSQPMSLLTVWTHPTTTPLKVHATLVVSSDLPVLTLEENATTSVQNSTPITFKIQPPRAVQGALLVLKEDAQLQTIGVDEITFKMCP